MKCLWHLCNNKAKVKFCSKKCASKFFVDKRRKTLKKMAVDFLGGKCEKCSYDKCIGALEFHHKDPSKKDFGLSKDGHTKSWERIKKEIKKCKLLCANCHREIHSQLSNNLDF